MKSYDDLRNENTKLMDMLMKPHRINVIEILNNGLKNDGSEDISVVIGKNDTVISIQTDSVDRPEVYNLLYKSILTKRTRENLLSIGFTRVQVVVDSIVQMEIFLDEIID